MLRRKLTEEEKAAVVRVFNASVFEADAMTLPNGRVFISKLAVEAAVADMVEQVLQGHILPMVAKEIEGTQKLGS
jgi:hypothetical protein